jgi:hypothetical protein
MAQTLTNTTPLFTLTPSVHWSSFEQFRMEGSKALSPIKEGVVATLSTKTGQYRILEEQDFQKVLGLARDVERLRGGLRLIMQAVRVVQKHPDDTESLNLLLDAVTVMGGLPDLPIREHFDKLLPETTDLETDDDVELDPDNIERPFAHMTVAEDTPL